MKDKLNKQTKKLLQNYHKTFDCFGNRKKAKKDTCEWYVTTVENNNFEYVISKKNNTFYINKKIPNKSCYPKYYNNKYAGQFIEVQFDKAKSLKKAKQIITNDKEM